MKEINVTQIIEDSHFDSFRLMIVAFCAMIIAFDGYDLIIYGSVVPILLKEWSMTPIQAGMIGSYALVGMMLGALFFGTLADRIGRKTILIICLTIFSFFTFLGAFAQGPTDFGVYRFLAGIGLGGVMPNAVTLTNEYAPKRIRSLITAVMFCGYSIGGMLAAGLSIYLIPEFGWRSVFVVGGLPLLLIPLLIKYMPESLTFQITRGNYKKITPVLKKMKPDIDLSGNPIFTMEEMTKKGFPVSHLFKNGFFVNTVLFWILYFMCLLMIYGLVTWLPQLMVKAGYPLGSSLTFLFTLNLASIIGSVIGGYWADRYDGKKVLCGFYLTAAISIFILGFKINPLLLYTFVGVAGATTIGTQNVANAFVSRYYPSAIRSTGLGWAFGIGRIGAILGPTLGGVVMSLGSSLPVQFLTFAIPGIIAAFTVLFVRSQPLMIPTKTVLSANNMGKASVVPKKEA